MNTSDIQVGDKVLVRNRLANKGSPLYEREPLQVQCQVMAQREDGISLSRKHLLTSRSCHINQRRRPKSGQWGQGSTLVTDGDTGPNSELEELTSEMCGESVVVNDGNGIGEPASPQPMPPGREEVRTSQRLRKEVKGYKYLKER